MILKDIVPKHIVLKYCCMTLAALPLPSVEAAAKSGHEALIDCPKQAEVWVDHYASIAFRESPFEDMVGTHRLTQAQARSRNHYRFAYAADRRLISLTFALGDIPRSPNHTANALSEAPVIEICYPPGMEVRHFRDPHGNPIYTRGNVAEERYVLDGSGYRTALTFHGADGQPVENGWGIARYDWSMQKNGSVIEDRYDGRGRPAEIRPGFPFFKLRLNYGPNGWLALMDNIDAEGELLQNPLNAAQDKLEYRANGEMQAWNVYDAQQRRAEGNGPQVARGIRGFNADGMEVSERYEGDDGKAISNAYGFTRTHATFDHYGNMLSRFNQDASGAPIDNPRTGYAGYVMSWDAAGLHRLSMEYRDANGQPAVHSERGYHRLVERYDAAGDRVEIQYQLPDGTPVARLDTGVASERFEYDQRHRLIARRSLDAQGRPVAVDGLMVKVYRYRPDGFAEPGT